MGIFKKLIKNKLFMLGLLVPIFFQIIFLSIVIPAIKDGNDRVTDMNIAVVNEDTVLGVEVSSKLFSVLPFKTEKLSGLDDALDEMENGDFNMVIYIPSDFTLKVQQGEAQISYYINQAAPSMTKQMMEAAALSINQTLNEASFTAIIENLKQSSITVLGQTGLPEETLAQISSYLEQAFGSLKYTSITGDIQKVNNADGLASTVFPFLIFLIYFISCILLTVLHALVYKPLKSEFSTAKVLLSQLVTNIVISLVIPGVFIGLLACFDISFSFSLAAAWILLSAGFFTFLYTIQAFTNWFGLPGVAVVVLLLPLQLVSSGLIYSKEILPSFYSAAGDCLPATYFGNGMLKMFYGGASVSEEILMLLLIAVIMMFLSTLSVFRKKELTETVII
jgi:uncharacterized phage infection (PIP) family protein YhgE